MAFNAPTKRSHAYGSMYTLNDIKRKRTNSGYVGIQESQPVAPQFNLPGATSSFGFSRPASNCATPTKPRTLFRAATTYNSVQKTSNTAYSTPRKSTTPIPFSFQTESRHNRSQTSIGSLTPSRQGRSQTSMGFSNEFRANPMPLFSKPYVPVASDKPLTKPTGFSLASARRSLERQAYDDSAEYRRRQQELVNEQQRAQAAAQEAAEIQRLREAMTFRAQPISYGNPFICKQSTAPLTMPIEPQLHTQQRAEMRDMNQSQNWQYPSSIGMGTPSKIGMGTPSKIGQGTFHGRNLSEFDTGPTTMNTSFEYGFSDPTDMVIEDEPF